MGLFGRKNSSTFTSAAPVEADPALAALSGTYTIDPAHTRIGFVVRHAMVTNVRGSFSESEGTLTLDGAGHGPTDQSWSALVVDLAMLFPG